MTGSKPSDSNPALSFIEQEKKHKTGYLSFFGASVSSIPIEILQLNNLSRLNVNDCPIQELGHALDLINLRTLAISYTSIKSLTGIERLRNLETLECSGLSIEAGYEAVLALPNLRRLTMNPGANGRFGPAPREILSESIESCLERLRDYFNSLSKAASGVSNVKLFVYGNGEVGKTQLLRRLDPPKDGPVYDVRVPTTHGINVRSFLLPNGLIPPDPVLIASDVKNIKVRAWDFGGQDLYHGVHALFLRNRAIHLVAWTPSREGGSSRDSLGYQTANHPLQYWLSFARHRRSDASALIVAQTQADHDEDAHHWTSDDRRLMKGPFLGYFSAIATSARTTRGIDSLIKEILKSARHINQALEWVLVSDVWLAVEKRIEEIQAENESLLPGRRIKRVISFSQFSQIAKREGVSNGVKTLLHYLAATGVVIWDAKLFIDRIIVDQQWALDAIYAIFDRVSNISRLKRAVGRFTANDLAEWIWNEQGYTKEEQSLFLSLMLSCRVCFLYSINAGVQTYIAPSALPAIESVADVLALAWNVDWQTKQVVFEYDLLHDGVLRGLMYEVSLLGGENVIFWSNGFQFFDEKSRSRVRVVQERSEAWAGRLIIMVQTHSGRITKVAGKVSRRGRPVDDDAYDPSLELGAAIVRLIEDQEARYGIRPKDSHLDFVAAPKDNTASKSSRHIPDPQVDPDGAKGFFVSYAWGDDTPDGKQCEPIVEEFCSEARRRGIHINIDKEELRPGDSIIAYMDKLSQGNRVYIFINAKYLTSVDCMYELVSAWNYSRNDWAKFSERVKIYVLPSAEIFKPEHRLRIKEVWQHRWTMLKSKHEALDPLIMSKPGAPERLEIDRIGTIASCCYELLTRISDQLLISNFDEFCGNWLSEIG